MLIELPNTKTYITKKSNNKKMKKLILSLAIITGLSTVVLAQEKKDACCTADKTVCKVDSAKYCKDGDKKEMKRNRKNKDFAKKGKDHHSGENFMFKNLDLTDAQKTKMKELKKEHNLKMIELRKSQFEEMKSVLTPEQIAKFEASKKERIEKSKKVGTVRFDAATQAKLKELSTELKQKREAIKKTKIAPAAMEQKLKDLNEEYAKKRAEVVEQSMKK